MSALRDQMARNLQFDIAHARIGRALRDLEAATGLEVIGISLAEYDVTQIQDDGPRIIRGVRIETRRRASADWATFPNLEIPQEAK